MGGGGGRGLDVWGYWKRDTTRDLYFSFPWVSISWSLIIKFNRIWPVMFIMTVIFIIGNLSWTVCSLTGSPIHKAAGIKWSAFKELFTEYWHTGTNSRHNKSNPMSWLVLDIKYRSKDVLQTMCIDHWNTCTVKPQCVTTFCKRPPPMSYHQTKTPIFSQSKPYSWNLL